jgi:ABC-2 type transport system permease protein
MTSGPVIPVAAAAGAGQSAPAPATPRARPLPGLVRATLARSAVELKSFFRNRQSLVFTLLFPVLLLVIFGSIFGGTVPGTGTGYKQVFMAGIIAAGIMSVAFSNLAINISMERDDGTIRRLAVSPMPRSAYFAGKVIRVLVTALLETALLVALAVGLFHLPTPSTPGRWLTLLWVLGLGVAACSLLAVAFTAAIPNSRSAAAIVTPVYLVLQFISGVVFPYNQLPRWMQSLAAFFPLKWMAQGLRSVFLPDTFTRVEPAGGWEHGHTALVLLLWSVAGLVTIALTFRWRDARG